MIISSILTSTFWNCHEEKLVYRKTKKTEMQAGDELSCYGRYEELQKFWKAM